MLQGSLVTIDRDNTVLNGRCHTTAQSNGTHKLGEHGKEADLRHGEVRAATEVAYELATSLAPLPKLLTQKKMEMMAMIQSYLATFAAGILYIFTANG